MTFIALVNQIAGDGTKETCTNLKGRHGQAGLDVVAGKCRNDVERKRRYENVLRNELEKINPTHTEKRWCP